MEMIKTGLFWVFFAVAATLIVMWCMSRPKRDKNFKRRIDETKTKLQATSTDINDFLNRNPAYKI